MYEGSQILKSSPTLFVHLRTIHISILVDVYFSRYLAVVLIYVSLTRGGEYLFICLLVIFYIIADKEMSFQIICLF
jgi:hypothetical protein